MFRVVTRLWVTFLLFAVSANAQQGAPQRMEAAQNATRPSRADLEALRQADLQYAQAAQARNLDAMISFTASNASLLPPNSPAAWGREAVRRAWSQLFSSPAFSIRWQPQRAELSRDGGMGYTTGIYELTKVLRGVGVTERGKYVEVWNKAPDGTWKTTAQIWNATQLVRTVQRATSAPGGALSSFLEKEPQLAAELNKNPALINNPGFLDQHPELESFLADHPDIREELMSNPTLRAIAPPK